MATQNSTIRQSPREVRKRRVDYDDFLAEGETVVDADATVTTLAGSGVFTVQTFIEAPDARAVILSSSGGVAASKYKMLLLAEGSDGQRREIRIDYQVSEP